MMLCRQSTTKITNLSIQMKYEYILEIAGGFGRYQIFMWLLYNVSNLVIAPQMLFMVFGGLLPPELEHICVSTNCSNSTSNYNTSIDYHKIQFYSAALEFGLVGQQSYMNAVIISLQMAGIFVGPMLTGHYADKNGRKPLFILSFTGLTIIGLVNSLASNWKIFAACRFLVGAFMGGAMSIQYVHVTEFMPPHWRLITNVGGWQLGCTWLGVLALITKSWQHLSLTINAASIVVLIMSFWTLESPKWLIESGNLTEARRVILQIAKINKIKLMSRKKHDRINYLIYNLSDNYVQHTYHYWHLFYDSTAAIRCLVLAFSWTVTSLVYYGILFSLDKLTNDVAMQIIIMHAGCMLVDVVVTVLDQHCVKLGRRPLHQTGLIGLSACLLFLTVACSTKLADKHPETLSVVALLAIVLFVSMIWISLEIYNVEIFPTLIRSKGYSFCCTIARVGNLVAPQVMLLQLVSKESPYILFLVLSIANTILAFLFLPETKGKPLPDMPAKATEL